MPEIKPPKTINQQFLELPEKVRDWLTSERVTYTIIEINKKLDLFGGLLTVIPNLITKLVTKNLDPKNFIKELRDGLGLDDDQAQQFGREIVEKILRPIDLPLKETGVFIGLVYGTTRTAAPTTPTQPPPPPKPAVPIPPVTPAPTPPAPPTGAAPAPQVFKVPINITESKPPLPPIKNENLESRS